MPSTAAGRPLKRLRSLRLNRLRLQQNPLRRMGDPEHDIGGVALFFASEDSDYVTGNTIFASGGTQVNGVQWDPPMPD